MKLFIGDIIQKLRKIKGLTQEQVANALGITTSSVSKWETNNTYPDISLLSPLARLLRTAVDNVYIYIVKGRHLLIFSCFFFSFINVFQNLFADPLRR